ncbi:hypothetical protein DAPPUDRAFT_322646 [Daphnia pulex]|uniref:Uncharacterized protein n=1 Tax=Daphnia pulex TaxID=6669 RepID=E9GWL4_DAPPU|nr:hypothetical protein DAPPUDRAFT_322646 [Daphnia pulex]|eukprot:EFX76166.1 hypothetical protein DAPPUDRAFT_322646 [Daphnia pulex]
MDNLRPNSSENASYKMESFEVSPIVVFCNMLHKSINILKSERCKWLQIEKSGSRGKKARSTEKKTGITTIADHYTSRQCTKTTLSAPRAVKVFITPNEEPLCTVPENSDGSSQQTLPVEIEESSIQRTQSGITERYLSSLLPPPPSPFLFAGDLAELSLPLPPPPSPFPFDEIWLSCRYHYLLRLLLFYWMENSVMLDGHHHLLLQQTTLNTLKLMKILNVLKKMEILKKMKMMNLLTTLKTQNQPWKIGRRSELLSGLKNKRICQTLAVAAYLVTIFLHLVVVVAHLVAAYLVAIVVHLVAIVNHLVATAVIKM